jgi:hypothetical protein
MISEFARTRLTEVNKDKIDESEREFVLTETKEDGRAEYHLSLSRPSLLLKKLDKWGFDWLKQGKCADYVVLEPMDDGAWGLHIFEFKKTMTQNAWFHAIEQFKGAYIRAEIIAAFLGFKIGKVTVISCFREDRFSQYTETAIQRARIANEKTRSLFRNWNKEDFVLDCFNGVTCVNKKIHLDENGCAEGCLCQTACKIKEIGV